MKSRLAQPAFARTPSPPVARHVSRPFHTGKNRSMYGLPCRGETSADHLICACEHCVDCVSGRNHVPNYRRRRNFGLVVLVNEETCGSSIARFRSGGRTNTLYARSGNGRAWKARRGINTGSSEPSFPATKVMTGNPFEHALASCRLKRARDLREKAMAAPLCRQTIMPEHNS